MTSKRWRAFAALTAVAALGLSACGGGSSDDDSDGDGGSAPAPFNAAVGKIFNPSDKKGGTIRIANSGDWDTLDPGETYYGYSWNFARLYGRSLLILQGRAGRRRATSWCPTSPRTSASRPTAARPGPTRSARA